MPCAQAIWRFRNMMVSVPAGGIEPPTRPLPAPAGGHAPDDQGWGNSFALRAHDLNAVQYVLDGQAALP